MSLVGCWLKHFAKWNHPRFSVQEWLPSWILTPVMWKRPMCWEMDGLKASWWSPFVHLSAAGDVWHLGDVKRAVRWLPSLCPHNVGNGFGALPSHCMQGIWRQRWNGSPRETPEWYVRLQIFQVEVTLLCIKLVILPKPGWRSAWDTNAQSMQPEFKMWMRNWDFL